MVLINKIDEWIEANKRDFVPPVCNKCMFANQQKVFFVGGPNQRLDYHLEEGDEVFYQKRGGMVLKVVEQGIRRDLPIKEGEIFLLPSRVEHSPQRFEYTIGFVVERTRKNTEFECVRYFVGDTTERLYERWIHLTDVVKDLPPVIDEFKASDEFKLGTPGNRSFIINAPYEPRKIDLERPIVLSDWLVEHAKELSNGPKQLYGAPNYKTTVTAYGAGKFNLQAKERDEIVIWIINGSATVTVEGKTEHLTESAMIRVDPGEKIDLEIEKGHALSIDMPTYAP